MLKAHYTNVYQNNDNNVKIQTSTEAFERMIF